MIAESSIRLASSAGAEAGDGRWRRLYRIGGVAALITVALTVAAVFAHIAWPPPAWSAGAAGDWFARFRENRALGLLGLDLLIVVGLALGIPVFLALYAALRRAGESEMAVATATALVGTVLHLTSNTAFEMLALSEAYAVASTEAARSALLAAGEAKLAAYYGTAFHASYVFGYAAKVVIGLVMLRSAHFGKATGYVGMLAGVAGFGFYVPGIGLYLSILSVLFIAVWYVMVGRALLQLGRDASPAERTATRGRN
jgi:hypothetical protein